MVRIGITPCITVESEAEREAAVAQGYQPNKAGKIVFDNRDDTDTAYEAITSYLSRVDE